MTRSHAALAALLTAMGFATFSLTRDVPPRPAGEADMLVVRGYVGRDLERATNEELRPLRSALRQLDPARTRHVLVGRRGRGMEQMPLEEFEAFWDKRPVYVWGFGSDGLLVFEVWSPGVHPSSCWVRLTHFGARGRVRSRSEFTTGGRRYLDSARLEPLDGGEHPLLVVVAQTAFARESHRQFYYPFGDRFDLVRLEREGGAADRQWYGIKHSRCGPNPPKRRAAEWEADLLGGDRTRLLRALTWVGGHHPGPPWKDGEDEDRADAERVSQVRGSPAVVARLKELSRGADQWVREGAELALKALNDN